MAHATRILALALLVASLLCVGSLGVGSPAVAQDDDGAYAEALQNGVRLAVERDFEGALAALRGATDRAPMRADAYLVMGGAQRLKGDLQAALEAFRTAARIATQQNDARLHAHALKGVAETLERMEGKRDEARQAWAEQTRIGATAGAHGHADVARARLQAIDRIVELDRTYAAVRQRIEERARQPERPARRRGAAGATGATPAPR